jgi:hypothetical protein
VAFLRLPPALWAENGKRSRLKIHFLDTSEHLARLEDYTANCGKVVSRAIFPYIADQEAIGRQELSGLMFCHQCLAISEATGGKRYLYGLVSEDEARKRLREGQEVA